MRERAFIAAVLFGVLFPAVAWGGTSTADPPVSLDAALGDPSVARSFDYCSRVDASGVSEAALEKADRILESATGQVSPGQIAAAILVQSGASIAVEAGSVKLCRRQLARGDKQFSGLLAENLRKSRKNGGFSPVDDPELARVQAEIAERWIVDQAARITYIGLDTEDTEDTVGAAYWAKQLSRSHLTVVDAEATRFMKELVGRQDWIDIDRFGARTSKQAWVLVQHADRDPEFQAEVLARMEPYLESGGVSGSDYAHLWDRVAVNTDRLQRYGTQPTWECKDGRLELQPLEDPETVDERRRAMGMGTVEDGLRAMAQAVCR